METAAWEAPYRRAELSPFRPFLRRQSTASKLTDGGAPANGNYDLVFTLYDGASAPANLIGAPFTNNAAGVTKGLFTVAPAAIQGLNHKLTNELKRRDAENAELKQRLSQLEQLVHKLTTKGE